MVVIVEALPNEDMVAVKHLKDSGDAPNLLLQIHILICERIEQLGTHSEPLWFHDFNIRLTKRDLFPRSSVGRVLQGKAWANCGFKKPIVGEGSEYGARFELGRMKSKRQCWRWLWGAFLTPRGSLSSLHGHVMAVRKYRAWSTANCYQYRSQTLPSSLPAVIFMHHEHNRLVHLTVTPTRWSYQQ